MMITPKQVLKLSRGVTRHAKKLPMKSEEILIRSERRGTNGAERGEEIMNVTLKFNEHSNYGGTCDSMSKECKQTCKDPKSISKVSKL